jgi:hypothetical protein
MKFLLLSIILILAISQNPYKEKKDSKNHSLYRERNDGDRISAYPMNLPEPIKE